MPEMSKHQHSDAAYEVAGFKNTKEKEHPVEEQGTTRLREDVRASDLETRNSLLQKTPDARGPTIGDECRRRRKTRTDQA